MDNTDIKQLCEFVDKVQDKYFEDMISFSLEGTYRIIKKGIVQQVPDYDLGRRCNDGIDDDGKVLSRIENLWA